MNIDNICQVCGLYQYSDNPQIHGKGSNNPKLILIGEAPGPDEAKKGEIFIGRAGKKLDQMIKPYLNLGIYITNAVKCFPPISTTNPSKGFRVPKPIEIIHCLHLLIPELSGIESKIVLMPMGNTALKAVVKNKLTSGITKYIGTLIHEDASIANCTVIPNYHPSYILRHPQMESEFIRVMDKAKDYINANSGTTGSS